MTEPLQKYLRPALSPERVERVWRRVAEQRDRKSVRVHRAPVLSLGCAFVAVLCVGAWITLSMTKGPGGEGVGEVARAPIARTDGRALGDIMTSASATTVALNDGSELQLSPETRLTPLDLSERAVVLHLVRGRARFAVKPGGPRRWVIEAGGASVEVVGTKFTVEREQALVNVRVEEGKVLVRSPSIQDGVTRLVAGQSLLLPVRAVGPSDEPIENAHAALEAGRDHAAQLVAEPVAGAEPVAAVALQAQPSQAMPSAGLLRAAQAGTAQARTAQASTDKATAKKTGANNDASQRANRDERAGFVLGALDAAALLEMADKARMKRDYREALGALDRVVQEHRKDPRAKLAAFTIGRIRDEELLDPERAAQAYALALSLGLSGPLAEDCRIRLLRVLETQVKRGTVSGQRVDEAAREYLQRYPKGRYAAEARAKLKTGRDGGEKLRL